MSGRGVVAALLVGMALTESASGLDLWESYTRAIDADPAYRAAQYSLEAARQKRREALSALLPAVTASASDGYTHGSTRYTGTAEVTRSFRSNNWVIELAQPVFRADSILLYDEAHAVEDQAIAQFAAARQDLILRVAQAYFDVVVAEHTVAAAAAQLRSLDEQLAAATKSFAAGVASVTDVDDSRSRVALGKAQQVGALNDLDARRAALEALSGVFPTGAPASLRPSAVLPRPVPEDAGAWISRATESNPAVVVARAALNAGEDEVRRARAQRLPTVQLVATYGSDYSSGNINYPVDYGTRARDTQLSLRLSVPIVDGGGMSAQVGEANAQRNKLRESLRAAEHQAALDARVAYAAILGGIAQVDALTSAVTAGESSVKGNRIGYGLGLRINSDVLAAEQQLFVSARDLEKARYDTLIAGLKLKGAVSDLDEGDLKDISNMLQPASSGD